MRKSSPLLIVAILLALTACKRAQEPEVSSTARAEAVHLANEAQLLGRVRDYAGAEKALARAAELDPSNAGYWWTLGATRAMQGNKSGAAEAYERELELHEKAAKKDKKSIALIVNQVRPLVLLGREKDARKLLEKAARDHPEDADLKALIAGKPIDAMLNDSKFRELMAD